MFSEDFGRVAAVDRELHRQRLRLAIHRSLLAWLSFRLTLEYRVSLSVLTVGWG